MKNLKEIVTTMTQIAKDPKNIYEVLQPIYYILKFIGLFPFSFEGPVKNGKLRYAILDGIWSILVLFIHIFFLLFNLHGFESIAYALGSKLLDAGWKFCTIFGICGGFFNEIYQICFKERIRSFLRILEDFDRQVLFFVSILILLKTLIKL